jgi:outer membrane lipoprotein-sorting protein
MTVLLALFVFTAKAQTADEIISNYLENTGGVENWKELEGIKIEAKLNQGGMEIPLNIIQTKDGKQMTTITFQGTTIKQGVFDGETLWNTNMATMKPEKAPAELTQVQKLEANDFPDSFIDYKEKGYTAELMGKETIEGAETYKIKLTKEPITLDGEEVENVTYYYFDTEAFVPVAQETEVKAGPQKGVMSQAKMSDYQEVDGFYFPFSMSQGVKDGPSQPIEIVSITLNPDVDDSEFAFPEGE